MFQLGKSEKAFEEAKRYMPGGVNRFVPTAV